MLIESKREFTEEKFRKFSFSQRCSRQGLVSFMLCTCSPYHGNAARPAKFGLTHRTATRPTTRMAMSAEKATLKNVYFLPDGRLMEKMPLSAVVSDAVRRWYAETEREANRGDVKAMALLGQMLMEGYGCDVDVETGKKWADKARRRGYRMQRVYCEI